MQGDLISRSRVIENIWDVFNSYANDSQRFDEYETKAINNAFKVLQKQIENQPTAYDVEKVVEELEEENQRLKKLRNDSIALSDHEVCDIENKAYNFAIKCVRNGGKE